MHELRVAWFADLFDEVSGVVTDTIEMHSVATEKKIPWFPITCYHTKINPFFAFSPILKIPTHSIYKNSNIYIPNFLSVINYLRDNQINMIISNTPASMGFVAMAAATFLKLPWVDIYHTDVEFYMNTLMSGFFKPLKYKVALSFLQLYHKQADLIFVRSHEYYNFILDKGHPKEKICYYTAGVDQSRFHPRCYDRSIWNEFNINPQQKIILFVGRITKVKDIHFMLDFFTDYHNQATALVIVGEGPEYELYVKQYGGARNIYFLGIQRGEKLQKIYASADLSISPSTSETLGKVVLEAMASGTTVLTSDKGGPKDYIDDSINGKIFKGGDYESFSSVLLDFLEGGYDLEKMGRAAYDSIKPYTMQKLFTSFWNSLKELQKKLNKD